MRTGAPLLVIALAALAAGCGGSGAKDNGEAAKTPAQVLADTLQATSAASAVHVAGKIVSSGSPITLDLTIDRASGAKGDISESGLHFQLIRVGAKAYVQGSDAFYEKLGGAAAAQLLHGKWLEGSATSGDLAQLGQFTDIDVLFRQITAKHGKLVNDGATTYQGQKVVAIRDTADGSKLYVAATGKPYPVAILHGKDASGAITFDGWNKTVSIAAPKGAIDLSQLGG